jgi:hypothetical protein
VFASAGLGPDAHLTVLAESAAKDRELGNLQDAYERSLKSLEDDLLAVRDEADDLRLELNKTRSELDDERRRSSSDKIYTEQEVRDLRAKLKIAEDEVDDLRIELGLRPKMVKYNNYITTKTIDIVNGDADLPASLSRSRSLSPLPRSMSPFSPDDVTQRVRQQSLISRFNDMFAQDRLDAMDTLRRFSDDYENNQRIVFSATQEAFTTARLAFGDYKQRIRSTLAVTHTGPETLEEAVQRYINRNTDAYDLPYMVSEVVRVLNRNPRLYLPPDVTFSVISPFIREALKMAWNMCALPCPLDIAAASGAELFDDTRYRRSYDSEFAAPLVNHHIWPCLMQGYRVLVKGEACTRRGASLSPRRSRSPLRSTSPIRGRSLSRSLSPRRSTSPLRRTLSPSRMSRSPSPSRSGRLTSSFLC